MYKSPFKNRETSHLCQAMTFVEKQIIEIRFYMNT